MMEYKHFLIFLIATASHSLFTFIPNLDLPDPSTQNAATSDVSGKKLYFKSIQRQVCHGFLKAQNMFV